MHFRDRQPALGPFFPRLRLPLSKGVPSHCASRSESVRPVPIQLWPQGRPASSRCAVLYQNSSILRVRLHPARRSRQQPAWVGRPSSASCPHGKWVHCTGVRWGLASIHQPPTQHVTSTTWCYSAARSAQRSTQHMATCSHGT